MCIIYKPKGKALEYSELAANLYRGCGHACTYCFAPKATFTDRVVFSAKDFVKPRVDIISKLEKDAEKMGGDPRPILLSFTSDIYQPANNKFKLSRMALNILNRNNLTATVLTKGGMRACEDFDLLSKNKNNTFAVTLTTDDDSESLRWEPNAALPSERIESLRIAKVKYDIKTWVSFEPVINPDAVLRLIEKTHTFVDLFKVGKLNYHPLAKTIDWALFLGRVEKALDRYGCDRYIKNDLEKFRR